jgi:hypothetical protein
MPLELLNINIVVCATSWWRLAPCVSNRRPGSPQSRQRPRARALLQRDAVLLPVRAAASWGSVSALAPLESGTNVYNDVSNARGVNKHTAYKLIGYM